MALIAERLSDEDISAVSAWLAAQPVPAHAVAEAASNAPWPIACGSVAGDPSGTSTRRRTGW